MPDSSSTPILSSEDLFSIPTAQEILLRGGLVAFPTDTVYGVGARFDDREAIERLFLAKGRDFNKAIAILVGNLDQVATIAQELSWLAQRLVQAFWPGALTVVVTRQAHLPDNLSPSQTIGVRMPDHHFARTLLVTCGPLATTSANISGGPNPITAKDVQLQLDRRIDLIIDGGPTAGGVPSTVVDCTVDPPTILRHGAISDEKIIRILQNPDNP